MGVWECSMQGTSEQQDPIVFRNRGCFILLTLSAGVDWISDDSGRWCFRENPLTVGTVAPDGWEDTSALMI